MSDFQAIAQQFCQFYYNTFDSDRAQLAGLYRDDSMLTFEAAQSQGPAAIIQKLQDLPFQKIQHKIDTIDAQPSNTTGGILVMIVGQLLVDAEGRSMSYSQTFQLLPADGSYYVFNDVFRLVYPAHDSK